MAVSPEAIETVAMLGRVPEAEFLEELAQDMGVDDIDDVRGNVRRLYRAIVARINSEAFDDMDDGGLAFIMAARDKLRIHLGITAPDPSDIPAAVLSLGTPKVEAATKDTESETSEESSSETEDVKGDRGMDTNSLLRPLWKMGGGDPQPRKELKLSGPIGKADEKGS